MIKIKKTKNNFVYCNGCRNKKVSCITLGFEDELSIKHSKSFHLCGKCLVVLADKIINYLKS